MLYFWLIHPEMRNLHLIVTSMHLAQEILCTGICGQFHPEFRWHSLLLLSMKGNYQQTPSYGIHQIFYNRLFAGSSATWMFCVPVWHWASENKLNYLWNIIINTIPYSYNVSFQNSTKTIFAAVINEARVSWYQSQFTKCSKTCFSRWITACSGDSCILLMKVVEKKNKLNDIE